MRMLLGMPTGVFCLMGMLWMVSSRHLSPDQLNAEIANWLKPQHVLRHGTQLKPVTPRGVTPRGHIRLESSRLIKCDVAK